MSTMSRLKLDQLSDHSYNNEKFQKLFFNCKNNVDWPDASREAGLDLGLLINFRIQFPPLSEGF